MKLVESSRITRLIIYSPQFLLPKGVKSSLLEPPENYVDPV